MSEFSHKQRAGETYVSREDWIIAVGTAVLALVLLGILPRMFW